MKILVTYYSETNNTKRIAEAINEVASKDNDSEIKDVKNVKNEELDNYDLIFLVSACHSADFAKPVLNLLADLPEKPEFKLAGFLTHSTYLPDEDDRKQFLYEKWAGNAPKTLEWTCKKKEIEYLGYFSCIGKPSDAIEKFIRKQVITEEEEWESYIKVARQYPKDEDIQNAQQFAKEILSKM
jgi:flavodoxin